EIRFYRPNGRLFGPSVDGLTAKDLYNLHQEWSRDRLKIGLDNRSRVRRRTKKEMPPVRRKVELTPGNRHQRSVLWEANRRYKDLNPKLKKHLSPWADRKIQDLPE